MRHAPTLPRALSLVIAWVAAALALAVAVAPARALDLEVGAPRLHDGQAWVNVRLSDAFPPRIEESLSRGMPARLQVTAELWRRRTLWFDRLTGSYDVAVKIRYDLWSRSYRIEGPLLPGLAVSTLDSLRLALSTPLELPLAPMEKLSAGARYYVVVSAVLKPLSVEDMEEGEGWLSGEVAEKRHAGLGILTAIPRSVFDAVRNLAGLGDQRARAISPDFQPEEIPR